MVIRQRTVVNSCAPRSYIIQTDDQGTYRRNRKMLLPLPSTTTKETTAPKTTDTVTEFTSSTSGSHPNRTMSQQTTLKSLKLEVDVFPNHLTVILILLNTMCMIPEGEM